VSLQGFVEELHKRRGLPQSTIAKTAGLSQGAIYKILAGMGKPEIQTHRRLAAAFPEFWSDYLKRHPIFQKQLNDDFSWSRPEDSPSPLVNPTMPRYHPYLEQLSRRLNELPERRRTQYETKLQKLIARLLRDVERTCAAMRQSPNKQRPKIRTRKT
jgi:DNA-binding XRE family transcriptional regulator